jgi:ABC-type multidrug transport system permease subunit
MIRVLNHSIYYHLLNFLRVKQAVFFTLAFPLFLFIVFGNIWGLNSKEYIGMLFTGVLGMTIASDGLFAIGPVVKEYYASGMIKYLRRLPIHVLTYFFGLIISRILSLLVVLVLLCGISVLLFDYVPQLHQIFNMAIGIVIGLIVFSFIGLCLSFSGIKHGAEKGLTNFVFFGVLFTSNAFYPVEMLNNFVGKIGNALPMNPVLRLLRGEDLQWYYVLWLVVPLFVFTFLFRKVKFNR